MVIRLSICLLTETIQFKGFFSFFFLFFVKANNSNVLVGDLEWEGSEADNEISDVTKEIPSNVFMIEDHEWNNIENFMAVVTANNASSSSTSGSRTQQPMYEDLALPGTSAQSSGVLALPPPTASTAMDTSEPVMTVAIPADMSMVSTQTGKLAKIGLLFSYFIGVFFVVTSTVSNNSQVPPARSQIARLLALAVRNEVGTSTTSSSGTELVPSHSNHRTKYPYRRRQTVEVNPARVYINILRLKSKFFAFQRNCCFIHLTHCSE